MVGTKERRIKKTVTRYLLGLNKRGRDMDIIGFVTSFFETTRISFFEAIMFICFGLSWPVSIIKALRTKIVHGKSPLFMSLIAFGYLCGVSHKILYSRDYLVLIYMFNLAMILTDLYLYNRYNLRGAKVKSKFTLMGDQTTDKNNVALTSATVNLEH